MLSLPTGACCHFIVWKLLAMYRGLSLPLFCSFLAISSTNASSSCAAAAFSSSRRRLAAGVASLPASLLTMLYFLFLPSSSLLLYLPSSFRHYCHRGSARRLLLFCLLPSSLPTSFPSYRFVGDVITAVAAGRWRLCPRRRRRP